MDYFGYVRCPWCRKTSEMDHPGINWTQYNVECPNCRKALFIAVESPTKRHVGKTSWDKRLKRRIQMDFIVRSLSQEELRCIHEDDAKDVRETGGVRRMTRLVQTAIVTPKARGIVLHFLGPFKPSIIPFSLLPKAQQTEALISGARPIEHGQTLRIGDWDAVVEGLVRDADEKFETFLRKAAEAPRWEDEDHGTNDVDEMRRLFRARLYPSKTLKN